jgi:lysophospholipase L1-like esterase
MVFIGDSITSGFVSSPDELTTPGGYCGFLDAYPAHLRNLLAPGVRISAVAFPGIKLVDSGYIEGMESKWFKKGPLDRGSADESDDWDFGDRDAEAGPTHIVVSIGTNDTADTKTFLQTYANFLDLLKETHGRRTGDILVLPPFGEREHSGSHVGETGPVVYQQERHAEIQSMVERVAERWHAETSDPLSTGDFPCTPIFEITKMQLEESQAASQSGASKANNRHSLSSKVAQAIASQPSTPVQGSFSPSAHTGLPSEASMRSLVSVASVRPSLVVRPSSIAAVTSTAKGTTARLHFVDTKGWLDAYEDTFDDVHPTRSGAIKIAKRLREWLGNHGFLAD